MRASAARFTGVLLYFASFLTHLYLPALSSVETYMEPSTPFLVLPGNSLALQAGQFLSTIKKDMRTVEKDLRGLSKVI